MSLFSWIQFDSHEFLNSGTLSELFALHSQFRTGLFEVHDAYETIVLADDLVDHVFGLESINQVATSSHFAYLHHRQRNNTCELACLVPEKSV